jgi:hypothetical protein
LRKYNLSSLADSFTTGLTINDSQYNENLQIRFIHVSKLSIFVSMDPDQPETTEQKSNKKTNKKNKNSNKQNKKNNSMKIKKIGRKKKQHRKTHKRATMKKRLPSNVSKGLSEKCSTCM